MAGGGHNDAPGIRIPEMRMKRCGVTSTETMTKKLRLWRMVQKAGDMKQVFVGLEFPEGLIMVVVAKSKHNSCNATTETVSDNNRSVK